MQTPVLRSHKPAQCLWAKYSLHGQTWMMVEAALKKLELITVSAYILSSKMLSVAAEAGCRKQKQTAT